MKVFQEGSFTSRDGLTLYTRRWGKGNKGQIILVHGFGDHLGRYHHLVQHLCERGYQVTGFDCRGHGRSQGKRGHVERFDQYVEDLHDFIAQYSPSGGQALFLLGHSQGGHICLRYLLQHPQAPFNGVILSSPFLSLRLKIPLVQRVLAKVASQLVGGLTQGVDLDIDNLSHDMDEIEATKRDPLYGRVATARWFTETLRAQQHTQQQASQVKHPLLLQQAEADRIVDPECNHRFFLGLGSQDKQWLAYPGYYHEIYNETPDRRGPVFEDLGSWLDEHLPPQLAQAS